MLRCFWSPMMEEMGKVHSVRTLGSHNLIHDGTNLLLGFRDMIILMYDPLRSNYSIDCQCVHVYNCWSVRHNISSEVNQP